MNSLDTESHRPACGAPSHGPRGSAGSGPPAGPELADEIALLSSKLSQGTYELLRLIGLADAQMLWQTQGALSCAAWLASLCGVELSTARSQVRIARALETYALLREAMQKGELSYGKARVLVPHLTSANSADLISLALVTPVGRLGAAIAAWSNRNEDADEIERRQFAARSLSWRADGDGMVTVTARLQPHVAARLCAVIDADLRPDVSGVDAPMGASTGPATSARGFEVDPSIADRSSTRPASSDPIRQNESPTAGGATPGRGRRRRASLAQQRADSLARLVSSGRVASTTTEVVLHVTSDGSRLTDGTPLNDNLVARILPESFISLLIHDANNKPIDASPRRRFPTKRQRRVVDARYSECAHPGCTATMFLQYDHQLPYNGHNTVIDNLRRLCGPHNRGRVGDRTGQSG